jgi:xylulokinase
MVAAVGVGVYKRFEEASDKMVTVTKRYEPNSALVERYEDAYQTWRTIYHALSGNAFSEVNKFQEKYR